MDSHLHQSYQTNNVLDKFGPEYQSLFEQLPPEMRENIAGLID